ncbi:MAG TPA: CDP-alcohol phosphatidyltransferase family protein [Candidatus Nanopelagicaceae bacterium]|nr:CDP-alcohol phosphatidyltransferase family protein [Candidatus Nanopelagicaceae bacterium]
MASNFRLRRIFRPLVKRVAHLLSRVGLSPNLATIIMLCFSIISFFLLVFLSNLLLFSIFIFATGFFDGVDGAIAREQEKVTKFGGFFDSIMDRISEFIIFLALLIYNWNSVLWSIFDMKIIILISFLSSIMISYLRARAEVFFKGDFDFGLMARSERLFYLVVTMLVANFIGYVNEFLFVFMLLVLATAFFRYFKIKNLIKEHENNM